MNKQKGITIGILALIVTMMVGYAIFSETITINGTATAKGEFDMTATCNTGLDSRFGTVSSLGLDPEGGYKNDSCTVSGNTVSLNSEFEYPGARRYFTIKMTNTGTIDSVINLEQDLTLTGKVCIDGGPNMQIDETNGQIEEADECHDVNSEIGRIINIYSIDPLTFEKADGTIVTTDEDIAEFFDESTGNITLKPGQSIYFLFIGNVMDYNDRGKDFLITSDVFYSFNWKQRTN